MRNKKIKSLVVMVLSLMFVAFIVLMVSMSALAQEGFELPINLEGVEVEVGGIVLVWSSVTMAVVQLLKAIKRNGVSILDTPEKCKLAAIIVGSIGILLSFALAPGATILSVLAKGIPSILGALGLYDLIGPALFSKKESASEAGTS